MASQDPSRGGAKRFGNSVGLSPAAPHSHRHGEAPSPPGPSMPGRKLGERFFLASALDRLAIAALVVGVIWLAVFWAMG